MDSREKPSWEGSQGAPTGLIASAFAQVRGTVQPGPFDRAALAGYRLLSYEELLTNAMDQYRDLYEKLAPDGLPQVDAGESDSTASAESS